MVHKKYSVKGGLQVGIIVVINYYWEADRCSELGAYVAGILLAFRNIQMPSAASVFRPGAPFLWPLGDLEWRRHERCPLTP